MAEGYINLNEKKTVVLTETDSRIVKENPHGLTREGAKVEFNEWMDRSKNRYMQARYASMLKHCKVFTNSGKLKDGRVILSRAPVLDEKKMPTGDSNGEANWCEWVTVDYERVTKRQWDGLPEEKRL